MKMNAPIATLKELARIYCVSEATLHRWSKERGLTRNDLADPDVVLQKLQETCTNDSLAMHKIARHRIAIKIQLQNLL